MTNNLRSSLIRLAHTNPDLRPHLLPLLKEAGCEKLPEGGMRDNCEKKQEEGESKTAAGRNVFLQDAADSMNNSWSYLLQALTEAQSAAKAIKQSGLMMDHSDVSDLYDDVQSFAVELLKTSRNLKDRANEVREELLEVSEFLGG